MFGLLFLVVVPLLFFGYFRLVLKISSGVSVLPRILILLIAFGIPLAYPFLYKFSPDFGKFNKLCNSPSRIKYFEVIPVKLFHNNNFREACNAATLHPYVAFVSNSKVYTPTQNFKTEQCKSCCERGLAKECGENNCVTESTVGPGDKYVELTAAYGTQPDVEGIFNTLLRTSFVQLSSKEYGVVAEEYNYTFYKYGTGWASILGAASGDAPSITCPRRNIDYPRITPLTN